MVFWVIIFDTCCCYIDWCLYELEKALVMISLIVESCLIYFLTVCFIFVCVFIDDEHLDDNDYIESHTSRFIQRLIFAFLIALFSSIIKSPNANLHQFSNFLDNNIEFDFTK